MFVPAVVSVLSLVSQALSAVPADDDVVAGWTAAVVFVGLALGVVVLGISLTRRLKNVDRAAEQGLYDPSDPATDRRPARGLAAAREMRERAAVEDPTDDPAED